MDINMEGNAFILDDKGNVVARIDNKNPRILVSKNLNEEKSIEAVNKYMKEKGLKTIAEVIKESAKEKEDTKTSSEMEI